MKGVGSSRELGEGEPGIWGPLRLRVVVQAFDVKVFGVLGLV